MAKKADKKESLPAKSTGYEADEFASPIPPEMMTEQMQKAAFALAERRQEFMINFGMAKLIAASGIYGNQISPQVIMATALVGKRFGWDQSTSMQNVFIIPTQNGNRPTMSAAGMRAVVEASGLGYIDMKTVTTSTAIAVGVRTHQQGLHTKGDKTPLVALQEPRTFEFSFGIEDAEQAGLTKKSNWKMYPREMLIARATAVVCRTLFPDLLAGMYAKEEIAEERAGKRRGGIESIDLGVTGDLPQKQEIKDAEVAVEEQAETDEEIAETDRQFQQHLDETGGLGYENPPKGEPEPEPEPEEAMPAEGSPNNPLNMFELDAKRHEWIDAGQPTPTDEALQQAERQRRAKVEAETAL